MQAVSLTLSEEFDSERHIEKVLGRCEDGDFSYAFWEPHQTSPYHCHPDAVEIYLCLSGGGKMRTPDDEVEVQPGDFVVHPKGELHEFINGPARSVLFRVRYGDDMSSRILSWARNANWSPRAIDTEYFQSQPVD